ncbi:MAG: hypothetical protein L0207_01510 [Chlamydiae bacterium]|nr:hypothetical protein [Chlamydiota bacterium]
MRLSVCLICIYLSIFSGYAASKGISHQPEFFSQASQDKFVYTILYGLLNKQDTGYYLEIGAGNPIGSNNTYFFEKNLGWKGVSIDILNHHWHSVRKNPLLVEDAIRSDYVSILQSFPMIIDYLSLDIDRDYDIVLQRIPFDNYIFKIITIEHDFYRFGNLYREAERIILSSLGYHLLCSDVLISGYGSFEDWWIHPSAFPADVFSALTSLDLKAQEHTKLIQIIQTEIQKIKTYGLSFTGK